MSGFSLFLLAMGPRSNDSSGNCKRMERDLPPKLSEEVKDNMSSLDDTQETTTASSRTQEAISAPDNTQKTDNDEIDHYSVFADDLLEETINEVRKLRPKLLEFMKRFGEQQGQMQCLKNEIADLRRSQENLAEFVSMGSSESDLHCDSVIKTTKTQNERLKRFANAVKTLVKHTNAARGQSAEYSGMNREKALEEARKELCLAQEEIHRKAMSGDVFLRPSSLNGFIRLPTIVDNYHTGMIVLDSFSLLISGEEPIKVKFNSAGELENSTFRIKEKQQYRMRLNFFVITDAKNIKYTQKVSRFRVNVTKKVFTIGSYTQSNTLQSFALPPEKAPEGLFHRGKHQVKSQILDENGREHISWNWTLKIVKDSWKKAERNI